MHPLKLLQMSRKPHLGEQSYIWLHYLTYNIHAHHNIQPIIPETLDAISKLDWTYEPAQVAPPHLVNVVTGDYKLHGKAQVRFTPHSALEN